MSMFKRDTRKNIGSEFLRMSMYYDQKYGHDNSVYRLFINEWRYTK